MASDWRIYSIDDLKDDSPSAIAIGPFGSRMKTDLYVTEGVPVIRGTNLANKHFSGEFVYVSEETADQLKSSNVFSGDLVFPHRGAIGEVGIVPDGEFNRYILSTSLMKLSCNRQIALPEFLYYFFRSGMGRHELLKRASTVGTPGIGQPLTSLKSIEVRMPELPEQAAIAAVLASLDDKIELNRKMNETLEAMARALLKSWFVDFDPVRAKTEGRDTGLPDHIAALFPDSFEDSEVGKIPAGWYVSSIKDIATNIQYGLTASAQAESVGPRFLRITDIQGGRINWIKVPYCNASEAEYARYRLRPHDIVVARTGASTGENIYLPLVPDAVFASYLVRFQFRESALARVVGAFMRTAAYFEYVQNAIGGSAQPNASAQVLASAKLVLPDVKICRKYAEIVSAVDHKIWHNLGQSQVLAAIRDSLLPKLISGEIRIDKVMQEAQAT